MELNVTVATARSQEKEGKLMTIQVFSNERNKNLKFAGTKMFEHVPNRFWGLRIAHGATTSPDTRLRVYNANLYYYAAELFDVFIFEGDDFYKKFADMLSTRNIEPTQQTIKIAEELVKHSVAILLTQPNFPAHMSMLYDKLYRTGVDNGREALQSEIKKLLDVKF